MIDAILPITQMETGEILNIFLVVVIIGIIVISMELADRVTTKCIIMAILQIMTNNKNKL